jgi:ubiquinone/menaquinone biosynthesis C-methylase UbiE
MREMSEMSEMSDLPRVLEPEVMDTAEEAADYDAMDHEAVNRRFCDDLLALAPAPRLVLDVGTGTALIPIVLCGKSTCRVVATDLAAHMLVLAKRNVLAAGFGERIELLKVDAKGGEGGLFSHQTFDVVMSNSIVHHIPEPRLAFEDMLRRVAPGGLLFVRDLERPKNEAAVSHLVSTYAANDTPRQRGLFEASLRAALTLDEVVSRVEPLGIPASAVARTSDRHWTLAYRKPA